MWWIHHGAILRGQDEHYKFPDTEQGSTGTTLQIINAGLEHAGIYEILLKEAGCEIRNVIDVYIFGEYWKIRRLERKRHFYKHVSIDTFHLQCNLKQQSLESIYNFDQSIIYDISVDKRIHSDYCQCFNLTSIL